MATADADRIGAQLLQQAKAVVLDYQADLAKAIGQDTGTGRADQVRSVLNAHMAPDYLWRGLYPFYEQTGVDAVVDTFWAPLIASFSALSRRPDVFLAGHNDADDGQSVWVCQMGNLLGLFDEPWLDIPPTNRMAMIRYAEFHRVDDGLITESALFFDLIGVMAQAGQYPLPPETGVSFVYPGPQTHDGLLLDQSDPADGQTTMDLVNRMVADLNEANEIAAASGDDRVPREALAKTWHEDMIWYGPAGIGASYTIDRYQQQHQYPFRFHLTDKVFNSHVARFAEGDYACFFGWSNLTNRPTGGFLGLPGSSAADMRVVDVYRRSGNKLAENWVFIDLPHWLSMQGLDVLTRMRQLLGKETF